MAKKKLMFFATREDIASVFLEVENYYELQYVDAGLLDSPKARVIYRLNDLPDLCVSRKGDLVHGVGLLIIPRNQVVGFSEIKQRDGGVLYSFGLLENNNAILLRIGGIYQDAALIASYIEFDSNDDGVKELFRRIEKVIKSKFEKLKSFYVGLESMEMLNKGSRLTINIRSPSEYDLTNG